jgi:hypothetical protein
MNRQGPDFDELVGAVEPDERARLLRVHEALLAAGPPPVLAPSTAPRTEATVHPLPRRRGALLALAAALGVFAFALGFVSGDRLGDPGTFDRIAMTGTAEAEGATASLVVYDLDAAGNWPMEVRVSGLEPARSGRPYQLWATRGGDLTGFCGSFLVSEDGTAVVPMNAPFRLDEIDGWVVVEEGSKTPLLTT